MSETTGTLDPSSEGDAGRATPSRGWSSCRKGLPLGKPMLIPLMSTGGHAASSQQWTGSRRSESIPG